MTLLERKIWSTRHGSFIATGETMDVDADALTPEAKIPGRRFLKGPIPWSWIAAAAILPSRALLVGLCLWRLAGAMKSDTVSFGTRISGHLASIARPSHVHSELSNRQA